uniref:Uncharacterized protein n=1 Tax=Rhizophora mucronata TaxID=61149 RepID=A0A2P2N3C6_RHIMU
MTNKSCFNINHIPPKTHQPFWFYHTKRTRRAEANDIKQKWHYHLRQTKITKSSIFEAQP